MSIDIICEYLEPQNMKLFGIRVIADVISWGHT